ncbi:MAG: DUF4494 domain-containing protein [Odoribacter sp.]
MIANYFESTVKYIKVMEDGIEKKVTELFLIDAMSFSETEAQSCKELSEIVMGDYFIQALKRSKITEYVPSNDERDDRLYKVKVLIIDADETSGKEKQSALYYLVAGENINKALENIGKSLSTFVVPYEVYSICDTKFVDVISYTQEVDNE